MDILKQLRIDHDNVTTLLDILDEQLHRVQDLKSADFDLMRDIMHYMTCYPDSFHHPLEDLVLERLIDRDPSFRNSALKLVKEHADLAKKSAAFLDMLQKVIDGALVLRKDIVARGVDYVEFLRSHMQREEESFFSRAEAALTGEDWNQISHAVEHIQDPVFGAACEAHYRSIYEFIQLHSGPG